MITLKMQGSICSGKVGSVCSGIKGSVYLGKVGSISSDFPVNPRFEELKIDGNEELMEHIMKAVLQNYKLN